MGRVILCIVFLFMVIGCIQPPEPAPRSSLFVSPVAMYFPTITKQGCLSSVAAEQFATLLSGDSRQERKTLLCHPALVRTAQARALDLANRRYFAHCTPEGVCPNEIALAFGCKHGYGKGNLIESIGAGTPSVNAMYAALVASPAHARHLLGQTDFFRKQVYYGIAVVDVPGSPYRWYYAIETTATCEGQ